LKSMLFLMFALEGAQPFESRCESDKITNR
jgi:hypothetical protein